MDLQVGDCLLYAPVGFYGWVIATKTWHKVAHCEVYSAVDRSWASRDGQGVDWYPTRTSQLTAVLRPTAKLDLDKANRWAVSKMGTPYGWLELLNFVGVPVHRGGMFCSQFLVEYYRAGGWEIFPYEESNQVAPFEFLDLVGEGFTEVSIAD